MRRPVSAAPAPGGMCRCRKYPTCRALRPPAGSTTSRSPGKGCTCDRTTALGATPGKRSDCDNDFERVPRRIEESLESIHQLFALDRCGDDSVGGEPPAPTNPIIRGQIVTG